MEDMHMSTYTTLDKKQHSGQLKINEISLIPTCNSCLHNSTGFVQVVKTELINL